jgi:hypothetical protein
LKIHKKNLEIFSKQNHFFKLKQTHTNNFSTKFENLQPQTPNTPHCCKPNQIFHPWRARNELVFQNKDLTRHGSGESRLCLNK